MGLEQTAHFDLVAEIKEVVAARKEMERLKELERKRILAEREFVMGV